MDLRRIFERARQYGDAFTWLIGVGKALLSVVGGLAILWAWGRAGGLAWLRAHAVPLWLVALSFAVAVVCYWTYRLRSQLQTGFRDKFDGDLRSNWDFRGEWRIPEKGVLLVTGGEAAPGQWVDGVGITKVGAQWENYTFTFRARIVNSCLGVVVRAQDMRNFYMLQIAPAYITPHRQVSVPVIRKEGSAQGAATRLPDQPPVAAQFDNNYTPTAAPSERASSPQRSSPEDDPPEASPPAPTGPDQSEGHEDALADLSEDAANGAASPSTPAPPESRLQQVQFVPAWVFTQATPIVATLVDWFDAKVTVRGQSVALYIDGELVLHKESFLQNPVGKVGFRNWAAEEALVRDVRVRLER